MGVLVRLAECHAVGMVSAVWCLCLWSGAVALCVALWRSSLAVVVSGLAVCLWWSLWLFWCAVCGAVSLVLSCCLVLVSSLVVWWCLLVSGILSATPKMSIHTKRRTTYRSTSPFAYHTINLSSNYSITNFFTPNLVFPNFFSLVDTCFSGVLGVSISTFCTGVFFMIFLVLFIGLLCLMTSSKSL